MKKFLLLGILVILGFSACDKSEPPQRVINIDKEFTIEMIEELSPDQNRLAFKVTTIENQDCANSSINYSSISREGLMRIILEGINIPADCISGSQQVSAFAPFDAPNAKVDVEIQLSDVINNLGRILVNDSGNQYTLTMETDHGFRIKKPVLNTIPKGYFWGYIGTNNAQIVEAFDVFSLEINGEGEDAVFPDGNYGHFDITDSSIIDVIGKGDLSNEKLFLKKLTGSKEQIKQVAEEFRVQYGTDLVLKVFTSEGEVY